MLGLYFIILLVCTVLGFIRFIQTRNTVLLTIEMFRQTHGKILDDNRVTQPIHTSTYGIYDRNPIWSYSNFVGFCLFFIVLVPVTLAAILSAAFGNSVFAVVVISVAIVAFFLFSQKCDDTPSNLYIAVFMDGVRKIKEYGITKESKG